MNHTRQVRLLDLGSIEYQKAWDWQSQIHRDLIALKRGKVPSDPEAMPSLLLCEHPPVVTLGRSGKKENLLWDEEQMQTEGIEFYKINRGGDITYHGPGQLVVYPVLDLEEYYRDVHRFVRELEEVIIRLLKEYGLSGVRHPGYTGVWIDDGNPRKICAIGIHLSRWVSLHGLALNVATDLSHFDAIIPCGIQDENRSVTSIQKELQGQDISMSEVKQKFAQIFAQVFRCSLV